MIKMSLETIKMSSKGQVVIPLDMREEVGAGEGTLFAAMSSDQTIILKKLETPSTDDLIKELTAIAKEGKKRLQQKGMAEADIPKMVAKSRTRK